MDPRLGRRVWPLAVATLAVALAVAAGAQDALAPSHSPPTAPAPSNPVATGVTPVSPAASPTVGDAAVQAPAAPSSSGEAPTVGGPVAAPDQAAAADADAEQSGRVAMAAPAGPPTPLRAPSAILRVLDKVTAETMAFDAPIGRRVRFKGLVFEVKACETRDIGAPQPQPAAYLLITSDAGVSVGPVLAPRQVFKGWMFANAPDVHAVKHPVYDAWLVSCSTAAPAT